MLGNMLLNNCFDTTVRTSALTLIMEKSHGILKLSVCESCGNTKQKHMKFLGIACLSSFQ